MKILITGSSGLIGSALLEHLSRKGHETGRLLRTGSGPYWNIKSGTVELGTFGAPDAVIHLAGANIAGGRWSKRRKAIIANSRLDGTRVITDFIRRLEPMPKVFISASAVGFYGHRGDEIVDEDSTAGDQFVSWLAKEWEAAALPAKAAGIRVVNIRTGLVLSKDGGVLPKMALPFRLGLGGVVGSGKQYISWIAIEDVIGAIDFILANEAVAGPVNLVSPNPVTNREWTKTLGRVLRRPTIFWMPSPAARLLFGEMAEELLLSSTRVAPKRLLNGGYQFQSPNLEQALRRQLAK